MTDSCKHVSRIKSIAQLGVLSPERWHCNVCQTSESVWACLSCGNFACGRYIREHALEHFKVTQHPLCFEVNEKFVFWFVPFDKHNVNPSYLCDDFVLNDNPAGDIKLIRMALDAVSAQDFDELCKEERGRRILRYHIRDPKRHTAPFANFVMNHRPDELLPQPQLKRSHSEIEVTKADEPPGSSSPCIPRKRAVIVVQPPVDTNITYPPSHSSQLGNPDVRSDDLHASSTFDSSSRLIGKPNSSVVDAKSEHCDRPASGNHTESEAAHSSATTSVVQSNQQTAIEEPIKSSQSSSLYEELYNIFHVLWSGNRSVVSPSSFLYTVWSTLPSFKGYKQQDAEEFLSIMLDRLQSEISGHVYPPPSKSRDFISRTFQGFLVSHVQCSGCGRVACTEEPFSELSLALPSACYSGESTVCELADLLRQFSSPTVIDDDANYTCEVCNRFCRRLARSDASNNSPGKDLCRSSERSVTEYNAKIKGASMALPRLPTPTKDSPVPFPIDARPNPSSLYSISPSHQQALLTSSPDLRTSFCSSSGSSSCSCTPCTSSSFVSLIDSEGEWDERGSTITNCLSTSRDQTLDNRLSPARFRPSSVQFPNSNSSRATQTIRLTRLPRILRLHIKRFRWIGRQREKVNCHVAFPLLLDLADVMLTNRERIDCGRTHIYDSWVSSSDDESANNESHSNYRPTCSAPNLVFDDKNAILDSSSSTCPSRTLYQLTGVIVHHGRSFQSGHYTAYCLNDDSENWLHCNDSNVSVCDFSEVTAAQAYLLFYAELMPSSKYPRWFDHSLLRTSSSCLSSMPRSSTSSPLRRTRLEVQRNKKEKSKT